MDFAGAPPRRAGRYWLFEPMAAGGMATIHLGRLSGPSGFSRPVAIKRLHEHLARDPKFVAMFLDEARIASRVRHPNVVGIIDVVPATGEVLLVMELVRGESLGALLARSVAFGTLPAPSIASRVMLDVLEGLQAAHDAIGEEGAPLGVVHRDVSPQNVLVGVDGVARVADFGIAKALGRMHQTRSGEIKGKLAYMAPEILDGGAVDARADVYGAAVVLWELLTGRRMFEGDEGKIVVDILTRGARPPSSVARWLWPALDEVVLGGLARDPAKRFSSTRAMARALESACPPAPREHVTAWVSSVAQEAIAERDRFVQRVEGFAGMLDAPESRRREDLVARVSRRSTMRGALIGGGVVAVLGGVIAAAVWWSAATPGKTASRAPGVIDAAPASKPKATVKLTSSGSCSVRFAGEILVSGHQDALTITSRDPFVSLLISVRQTKGTVEIDSAKFKHGERVSLSTDDGHWASYGASALSSPNAVDVVSGKVVLHTYRLAEGIVDLELVDVVLESSSYVDGRLQGKFCTINGTIKTTGRDF